MAYPLDLPTYSDQRGSLTVIEKILPFDVKRVYYIYGCGGQVRGGHRHIKTMQGFVCLHGSCVVDWDNGKEQNSILLNKPSKMLMVPPEDWHVMRDFSPDAVLLVLASDTYDAADYIDEGYKHD